MLNNTLNTLIILGIFLMLISFFVFCKKNNLNMNKVSTQGIFFDAFLFGDDLYKKNKRILTLVKYSYISSITIGMIKISFSVDWNNAFSINIGGEHNNLCFIILGYHSLLFLC